MKLRASVLGEPANHAPFPFFPTSTFVQSKNY